MPFCLPLGRCFVSYALLEEKTILFPDTRKCGMCKSKQDRDNTSQAAEPIPCASPLHRRLSLHLGDLAQSTEGRAHGSSGGRGDSVGTSTVQ